MLLLASSSSNYLCMKSSFSSLLTAYMIVSLLHISTTRIVRSVKLLGEVFIICDIYHDVKLFLPCKSQTCC